MWSVNSATANVCAHETVTRCLETDLGSGGGIAERREFSSSLSIYLTAPDDPKRVTHP